MVLTFIHTFIKKMEEKIISFLLFLNRLIIFIKISVLYKVMINIRNSKTKSVTNKNIILIMKKIIK